MNEEQSRLRTILIVRIALSFVVLVAALYVILSNAYPDAVSKWAIGIVGLIVGYWLK